MDAAWTIAELAERAAAALAAGAPVRVNGRVRDLPNARLIRWYTTIGLLDPPLGRRGRTALYGRRHLLQLVAVKRRQSQGRSIAEIQRELTGATDVMLREIAALPEGDLRDLPAEDRGDRGGLGGLPAEAPADSRPRFWAARPDISFSPDHEIPEEDLHSPVPLPAELREPAPRLTPQPTARPTAQPARRSAAQPAAQPAALVQGIRLAPGVVVMLDAPIPDGPGPIPPTPEDLTALQSAARPLLAELHRRGLLPAGHTSPDAPRPQETPHSQEAPRPHDSPHSQETPHPQEIPHSHAAGQPPTTAAPSAADPSAADPTDPSSTTSADPAGRSQ
ncbi:MerR family transcriptional regulator [Actinomadura kijaniata]|uniref:MerR family transcriptional regulator n=1 Tax=Actinomadura kijaniata TaxID=46161 RepID=UPI0008349BC1|nr:MerR family transcriptional regulator [Actinomadura kijaniata]